ncbi:Hypothetical protein FKW44_006875, partial [Caligus rogercresseyi]
PFINYLKRRQLDLTVSMSTKVIRIRSSRLLKDGLNIECSLGHLKFGKNSSLAHRAS